MILTADIGNTNICFALHEDDAPEPLFFERIHTDREKTALEYTVDINIVLNLHGVSPSEITAAAVSSVVPAVTGSLRQAMESLLTCNVLEISGALDLGFENLTDDPMSVGNDILCDISGALHEFEPPIITFDMGTATVATIIDRTPALSGVLITAGVRTGMNSLTKKAAALTAVTLDAPERSIGKNTVDAMKSGLIYGNAGLLDGIIDRIEEETKEHYNVVATGGLSSLIVPYASHAIHLDPTLLMKGMWHILKRNIN